MSTEMERVDTTNSVLNSTLVRLQWKHGVSFTFVDFVLLVNHAQGHVRLCIHTALSPRHYRFLFIANRFLLNCVDSHRYNLPRLDFFDPL